MLSWHLLVTGKEILLRFWQNVCLSPLILVPAITRIVYLVAPVIMTPRMIGSASSLSSRQSRAPVSDSRLSGSRMDFVTLGRAPVRLGMSRRITSRDLQIVEATDELLQSEVPEPDGVASTVSLWRGFNATVPSAELGKARRRQTRSVEAPHLGLKRLGMSVRGIMTDEEDHDGRSVASEDDVVIVNDQNHRKAKRKGRESLSAAKLLGKDELTRQKNEILRDKENIHVKRVCSSLSPIEPHQLTSVQEPNQQRDCRNIAQNHGTR
jgi:mitochondrial division protein 1